MRKGDRRKLLTPDAEPNPQDRGMGCYPWLAALLLASLIGVLLTDSKIVLGLAVVFAALACTSIYAEYQGSLDRKRFGKWADKQKQFGVVVTSDSPKWATYINDRWLTRFGNDVSVLNYSRKREWAKSIESRAVNRFSRFRDDYPAVIVRRKIGEPAIYIFRNAFVAAWHGDDDPLKKMEERLFKEYADWQQRD